MNRSKSSIDTNKEVFLISYLELNPSLTSACNVLSSYNNSIKRVLRYRWISDQCKYREIRNLLCNQSLCSRIFNIISSHRRSINRKGLRQRSCFLQRKNLTCGNCSRNRVTSGSSTRNLKLTDTSTDTERSFIALSYRENYTILILNGITLNSCSFIITCFG